MASLASAGLAARVPVSSVSNSRATSASSAACSSGSTFLGSPFSLPPLKSTPRSSPPRSVAIRASAATAAPPTYELPTWTRFELGLAPVFWEAADGGKPASGQLLTIWFHSAASELTPSPSFGIAFNGGFNSPIMCGGEPREMTRKERVPNCSPFFSIRINVPIHARSLVFSFTDGQRWDGPYIVDFELPPHLKNKPPSFFNEGLAKELSANGACDSAIFPDAAYIQDRCIMPGGLNKEEGASCQLDIVPGCMDPLSPSYDPLANIDNGTCEIEAAPKGTRRG